MFRPALLALAVTGGCGPDPGENAPPDTVRVFDEAVIVFMTASDSAMDAARAGREEDDFYTMADDLMWYRATAQEFLEQQGVPVISLLGRRPLHFLVEGEPRRYEFTDLQTLDVVVLYQPGKEPMALPPISTTDGTGTVEAYFASGP
ncbi:MAG TPA: hypothetical protein VMM12_06635 [Longimicrobiales bacterium]|nr:hypothetical protein [Longimicrobiales bacterium]